MPQSRYLILWPLSISLSSSSLFLPSSTPAVESTKVLASVSMLTNLRILMTILSPNCFCSVFIYTFFPIEVFSIPSFPFLSFFSFSPLWGFLFEFISSSKIFSFSPIGYFPLVSIFLIGYSL